VESILGQSYSHLEILLVDDGSTDHSGAYCDQAAQKDERVRVLHKANGGLSDARNAGIAQARGEYITFVDGDDYVHKNFIKTLLGLAVKHDTDIAVCSYFKIFDRGQKTRDAKAMPFALFTNTEAIRDLMLPSGLCEVMAWNKLYKRDLFKKKRIQFPVGKIHEDMFTTYKLFFHSRSIAFTDRPLYNYIQRSTGIIGAGYSRKSLAMVEAVDEMLDWLGDKGLSLRQEALAYRLDKTLYLLSLLPDEATYRLDWRQLSGWVSEHRHEMLFRNRHVPSIQKVIVALVLLGRRPYFALRWRKKRSSWRDRKSITNVNLGPKRI
jgi:glycosyltransferase involved in cell wall biosynthesis